MKRVKVGLSGRRIFRIQLYRCGVCGRCFTVRRTLRSRFDWDVIREAVELYYDTRGSYCRVMNALHRRMGVRPSHVQIFRWIDELGENCKNTIRVAEELEKIYA